MNTKRIIPTHVIDCGQNSSTIYDVAKDHVAKISQIDVLNLPNTLPNGSTVVSEYSHLGCERTEFSLSQPFTRDLLLELYSNFENNDITLRLFPQKSTPRAIALAGLPKNDFTDPIAIYQLIMKYPELSLMKPPKSFDLSHNRKQSYYLKKICGSELNKARREDPTYYTDFVSQYIRDNLDDMYEKLSPLARDCFKLEIYSKSQKKIIPNKGQQGENAGKWKIESNDSIAMQAMYAIAVCHLDPKTSDFRYRLVKGGTQIVSIGFAKKYIMCMTPFHLKGGVVRSNLYHHGMRNWIARKGKEVGLHLKDGQSFKSRGGFWTKKGDKIKPNSRMTHEEEQFFLEHRRLYCKAIKELQHYILDNAGVYIQSKREQLMIV